MAQVAAVMALATGYVAYTHPPLVTPSCCSRPAPQRQKEARPLADRLRKATPDLKCWLPLIETCAGINKAQAEGALTRRAP